jgi:hypothetical protein
MKKKKKLHTKIYHCVDISLCFRQYYTFIIYFYPTGLLFLSSCRNYTNNSRQIMKLPVMGFSPQKKRKAK